MEEWKHRAAEAEAERNQLRVDLDAAQSTARQLEGENQTAKEDYRRSAAMANYFRQIAMSSANGLDKAMRVMQKVKAKNFIAHPAPELYIESRAS